MAYGGRRTGTPLDDRVEDFISQTGVDEGAAAALRNESSAVVRQVLEEGMRPDVRNPSALLMSMIKNVKQDMAGRDDRRRQGGGGGGGGRRRTPLDDFIDDHRLDERCQAELRGAPEDVIRRILDGGPLDARNPSSAVMAMIRNGGRGGPRRQRMDLNTFIQESGIDAQAEDALRKQSEDVIRAILDEGIVEGWNTSALLMKRIRQLNEAAGNGRGAGPPPLDGRRSPARQRGGSPMRRGRMDLRSFIRDFNIDAEAEDLLRAQTKDVINMILDEGLPQGCRNPSAMLVSRVKSLNGSDGGHPGDRGGDRARGDRGGDWGDRGDHGAHGGDRGWRDGDWDRGGGGDLRDNRHGGGGGGGGAPPVPSRAPAAAALPPKPPPPATKEGVGGGGLARELEEYLAANQVDHKAGETLRAQSDDIIRKILGEGVMAGRNPSALLMARIRQLTAEPSATGEDWDHAPWRHRDTAELESFVKEAGLDVAAAEALYAQSEGVKRKIMNEDVANCRNPSAMVMKLIRTMSSGGGGGGGGGNDADVPHEPPVKKPRVAGGGPGGEKSRAGGSDGTHQPVSTRMCRHFQRGRCNYGDKCSFRHEEGQAADPSADDNGDAPGSLTREAEKELSEALEDLHTAAWDRGLPQEDFEAMMQRVVSARDFFIEAALQDEADDESRRQDDDLGTDPPARANEDLDEDLDGRGEDVVPPEADKKPRVPTPSSNGPPRPSSSPSAAAAITASDE